MKLNLYQCLKIIVNILFAMFCAALVLLVLQLFCFTSFRIPSDSMKPTLQDGDRIIVNKLIHGARIFNVFTSLRNERVNIYRLPGFSHLQRNDVIVFNFPYSESRWDSIRFDIMQYYVKRCIGLPGDTLEIRNGYYKIRGYNGVLGNLKVQQYFSEQEHLEKTGIVMGAFPWDETMNWTIKEFGPLYIPKKGQVVRMDKVNAVLYRQLISWEQKQKITLKDNDIVWLGDSIIRYYQFEKDYYFVSGDNMANSKDSRYWGLLPEEYIVGKAIFIWQSRNRNTGRIRWKRIMKEIK